MAKKGHNDINRNLLLLFFFFPLLFLKARKEGMCKARHRGTLLPPSPSPLHSDKAVTQGEGPSSLLLPCTDILIAAQILPNSGLSFFQGDPNKAQPVGPHVAAVILTSFTWEWSVRFWCMSHIWKSRSWQSKGKDGMGTGKMDEEGEYCNTWFLLN